MKYLTAIALALLLIASCTAAPLQDVGTHLSQLQSADESQRNAAVEALAAEGADVLAPLLAVIDGESREAGVAARLAIQKIVYRASAPGAADRSAVASTLVEFAVSHRSPVARRYALEMASFVGRDDVVQPLTRLLSDREVGEMARWALVRIPGEAATSALAAAVAPATGDLKAGLINALGARAASSSLPVLRSALSDQQEAVRTAAIQALARIPDASSEPLIRKALSSGSDRARAAASDSYMRLAGTLLEAGRASLAGLMYDRRFREAQSVQEKCAALAGLAKAQGSGTVPLLLKTLAGQQPALSGVAAASLAAIPGRDATRAISRALPSSRPETRTRLISILGQRRDLAALPALQAAAETAPETAERALAVSAIGQIGSSSAAPVLIRALGASEPVRAGAVAALAHLPGRSATRAVVVAIPSAQPPHRAALIEVLGYRRDPAASAAVVAALKDPDPAVRIAAINAAGSLQDSSAAPALLELLLSGSDDEQEAAQNALGRMTSPQVRQAMVSALPGAPDAVKAGLLRALGQRPTPDLLPVFITAVQSPNDAVAGAALSALGKLGSPEAASVLADAALTRSTAISAAAAKAYLSLGNAAFDQNPGRAKAIAMRALQQTSDADTQRSALGALAHLPDAAYLPLVVPLLGSDAASEQAARCVVAIADSLAAADKDKAIAALREVLARGKDPGMMREAVQRLRSLGVEVDPAADAGFVTRWWVIGPFKGHKEMLQNDPVPTGGPVDLSGAVEYAGKSLSWRPARVDDPLGYLDLQQAVADTDDCGACIYAEVISPAAQEVLFKMGSDDEVFCWLNGKLIHSYLNARGYSPDQDIVPASLLVGTNAILLKVLNGGGGWGVGLRITDRDGKPLMLKQRRE